MRKLFCLFVMIAGMTLATVNVNAQDAKSKEMAVTATCCKSGDKAACCKSGDKTASGKSCCKEAASACTKKDGTVSSQKINDSKTTSKAKN